MGSELTPMRLELIHCVDPKTQRDARAFHQAPDPAVQPRIEHLAQGKSLLIRRLREQHRHIAIERLEAARNEGVASRSK